MILPKTLSTCSRPFFETFFLPALHIPVPFSMIFVLFFEQDVTSDEFEICMSILGGTKLGVTITGHADLVALAIEQSEINTDIDQLLVDDELVERFIQCATHALPYFSVSFFYMIPLLPY